ncbi:glycosyltransferase [Hoeflea alexandrii]|uniref:glycosyltransferase n=1 Tax=Hoeflea alexandrii TaxID=288436 RepID=UPI0022B01372|nr:glycosyltransferase [Hoeflea alexandrii]MCZ4290309.1 glycosyltransferase [Hoeflea alexandrii]
MMKILMFTNTYTPHVGGVARSVSELAAGLRRVGDEVLVVAPEYGNMAIEEPGVRRIPAVQNFAGSDFSMPLPLSPGLAEATEAFDPDIIHSHHPFLLGDTALRTASLLDVPVVFTHHTRYELYGHYVAQDSELLKRLALSLSLGYCDLCDGVIAPSRSIAEFLADHGVSTPVSVVPTGVDVSCFAAGERARGRSCLSVPDGVFLAGHVGRLAPEKNLAFLAEAFVKFLRRNSKAHVLVVGDGPSRPEMQRTLEREGMGHRAHFAGVLKGGALADAYAAMDVFAFSSFSETQGLVLVEAMTTGSPVVALDAPGARDVVTDRLNGRLLDADTDVAGFAAALEELATAGESHRQAMRRAALETAADYAIDKTVARTRDYYRRILSGNRSQVAEADSLWARARRSLAREMEILGNFAYAAADAILPDDDGKPDKHG